MGFQLALCSGIKQGTDPMKSVPDHPASSIESYPDKLSIS